MAVEDYVNSNECRELLLSWVKEGDPAEYEEKKLLPNFILFTLGMHGVKPVNHADFTLMQRTHDIFTSHPTEFLDTMAWFFRDMDEWEFDQSAYARPITPMMEFIWDVYETLPIAKNPRPSFKEVVAPNGDVLHRKDYATLYSHICECLLFLDKDSETYLMTVALLERLIGAYDGKVDYCELSCAFNAS